MSPHEARIIQLLGTFRTASTYGADFNDKRTQQAWLLMLGNQSYEDILEALRLLAGNPEFPTPNVILKKIQSKAHRSAEESFDWLWSNLNRNRPPRTLTLVMDNAIRECGGWNFLCDGWREETRDRHRRQFIRVYNEIIGRAAQGEPLRGSQLSIESPENKNRTLDTTEMTEDQKYVFEQGEAKKIAMTSPDRRRGKNGGKSPPSETPLSDLIARFKDEQTE